MRRSILGQLAWLTVALLVVGLASVAAWWRGAPDRAERRDIEARNAAYDGAHPTGVPGAYLPAPDPDRLAESYACAPSHGVVDKAACAAARPKPRPFEARP